MLAVNLDVSLQFSVSCSVKVLVTHDLVFVRAGRTLVRGRYRSGARGWREQVIRIMAHR
jgi:hypothetical protein